MTYEEWRMEWGCQTINESRQNPTREECYDAGIAEERKRCAEACHPEDFELGSSEYCALKATQDEILVGEKLSQPAPESFSEVQNLHTNMAECTKELDALKGYLAEVGLYIPMETRPKVMACVVNAMTWLTKVVERPEPKE